MIFDDAFLRQFYRRWLALNEIAEEGQKPIITIYDLTTYKRRKILTVPFENSTAREFACVQFTYDSKYLVAITGEPDWYLYYYNWDKGKVESHAKAQNPSGQGVVESVSLSFKNLLRSSRTLYRELRRTEHTDCRIAAKLQYI